MAGKFLFPTSVQLTFMATKGNAISNLGKQDAFHNVHTQGIVLLGTDVWHKQLVENMST